MSTKSPILTKSFPVTGTAVAGHLILAAVGVGRQLKLATAATDALIGAADSMGAPANGLVDVDLAGISEVRFGGNVTAGDQLTADATSRAVKAVPVAGQVVRVIGIAMVDAVAGDISPYLIAPSAISTPAA